MGGEIKLFVEGIIGEESVLKVFNLFIKQSLGINFLF